MKRNILIIIGSTVVAVAIGMLMPVGTKVLVSGVKDKVVELHIVLKPETAKKTHTDLVELGDAVCSGSFVTDTGDILTARHCAEKAKSITVVRSDGREYKADIVAMSKKHDLALLHIDALNTPYFDVADLTEQGQTIFTYGSPLGLTGTLATGIVARLSGDITLIDCSVLPGNSGGPVFDVQGNMVGVATAGYVVMLGMTHLNLAQGIDAIKSFERELKGHN